MSLFFHIAVYVLAVIGLVTVATHAPAAHRALTKHRHNAVMQRIARLEIETGMGLSGFTHDWFDGRKPKTSRINSPYQYTMIGTARCLLCNKRFQRDGVSVEDMKLCPTCRRAKARIAV